MVAAAGGHVVGDGVAGQQSEPVGRPCPGR